LVPHWHDSLVTSYYTNYFAWWDFVFSPKSWASVFFTNFLLICLSPVMDGLGIILDPDLAKICPLGLLIIGVIPLINIFYKLRQRSVLPLFLLSYLLLILIWPWPPDRFIIPFLPLLLAFLFDGVVNCVSRIKIIRINFLPILLLGSLLIFSNIFMISRYYQKISKICYPSIKLETVCPPWSSYQDIFDWIKKHTDSGAVIGSSMDVMLYLYTGRQSYRPCILQPLNDYDGGTDTSGGISGFKKYLEQYHADYLVQMSMPGCSLGKLLDNLIREGQEFYPGWFTLVFQGQNSRFRIYRINPDKAP